MSDIWQETSFGVIRSGRPTMCSLHVSIETLDTKHQQAKHFGGRQRFGAFILSVLTAATLHGTRPSAANELFEVSGFLPVAIGGETVRLEGMLVKKADAQGKLPVVIITNGGLTPTTDIATSVNKYIKNARDFARRGWLAVVALRRGYGQSEGAAPQPMSCDINAYRKWVTAAADDLQATINYLKLRPDVDPQRFVVIGPEAGGAAAIALSARDIKGLAVVISIGGGLLAESNCSIGDVLTTVYREFGASNRVPNLWIHAKSDSRIDRILAERMHAAFLEGGGNVKFVEFHSWGDTSKDIFVTRWPMWMLQVDGFLREHGLPTWSETNSWEIVNRMKLTGEARNTMFVSLGESYVPRGGEQAIAFSPIAQREKPTQVAAWTSLRDTLEAARAGALEQCQKVAQGCVIVLENLRWVGPHF